MKTPVAILLFLACLCSFSFIPPAPTIRWMSWAEAEKAMAKQPKKIFVDVYTDWCGWCKKMDASTFSHPYIAAYINKNYYAVKFNAETTDNITYRGKVWKNTGRYNELASSLLSNQMSFPTTVYLDEEFNVLSAVPGYLDVPTAEKVTYFFGEGQYKKMNWEAFEKQYKSKL